MSDLPGGFLCSAGSGCNNSLKKTGGRHQPSQDDQDKERWYRQVLCQDTRGDQEYGAFQHCLQNTL